MTELNPSLAAEARQYTETEAPFNLAELIVSRSDKRGVVVLGNSVFQRLTGRDWDELKGAPHKVIRHPDMPKGLFQLMWDWIKAGKPIGAYVKNRDKSGRYYWVFAVVCPTEDGYVSVRLKPTGDMRPKVAELYAELLRCEREDGLTPSDSADALVKGVLAMGFSSYTSFQATALAQEFEARQKALGLPMEQLQRRFVNMSHAINDVLVETMEMTEAFKAIRTVPMNMRIIASRLEHAGGPISAISVNYSQMLEEMATWVRTFVDGDDCVFALIRNAILNGQFLSFVSTIEESALEAIEEDSGSYPDMLDPAKDFSALDLEPQAVSC